MIATSSASISGCGSGPGPCRAARRLQQRAHAVIQPPRSGSSAATGAGEVVGAGLGHDRAAPARAARRRSRPRSARRRRARSGGAARRRARSRMSSAATWPRPRSSASTRAAWTRPIGPRGLAPNSIIVARSASPCFGRVAGRVGERHRVADRVAVDEHRLRGRGRSARGRSSDRHSRTTAGAAEAAPDDGRLLADARVVDEDLHQEAVDLRLGQRVGALGLDRVLGRHHDERQRAPVNVVPPIVTCCSCITSSSADWTFAGARLISSASTKLANTGPSSVSKLPVSGR